MTAYGTEFSSMNDIKRLRILQDVIDLRLTTSLAGATETCKHRAGTATPRGKPYSRPALWRSTTVRRRKLLQPTVCSMTRRLSSTIYISTAEDFTVVTTSTSYAKLTSYRGESYHTNEDNIFVTLYVT